MCFSTSPRSWNLQKILKLKTLWSKKMLKVHSIVGTVTQKLSWIKSNTTTTIFTITKTTTIVNKFTLRESFGFFSLNLLCHHSTHTHTQMTQHPPIMVLICFSIVSLFLELSSFPTVSFFLLSLSKILNKKNVCWIFQVKTIKVFLIHCHLLNSHTKVRTSSHSSH